MLLINGASEKARLAFQMHVVKLLMHSEGVHHIKHHLRMKWPQITFLPIILLQYQISGKSHVTSLKMRLSHDDILN